MNMIKAEFYKLKKSSSFWICLLICAFFAALMPFALQQAVASGEPDVQDLSLSAVEIIGYCLSSPTLSLVAAVFVSIFVSGEFHYGTMKNYISKGFRREHIFLSKFAVCAFAVTAMFGVFVPVIMISGTIFLGFDPHGVFQLANFVMVLLVSWLLFMAYVAVFVAVSTILRSNGAAIATNICIVSIFPTLLQALDFLFGRIGFKISPLWIEEKLSAVTSLPLPSGALLAGTITAIVYLLLVNMGGIYLFKRHDVK
ncbi:MAG: ABC transporter permease [Muricoprocola sp.]